MGENGFQAFVEAIIRVVVERLDPSLDPSVISAETALVGTGLAFDSMAMLDLVTGLEDELGIMIDESKLDQDVFETVGALARFLEEHAE